MGNKLPFDFVLEFCRDKIPQHGEDSYCYSFCDTAGILGVFDGCGGAGARKHRFYSDNTEAYMASRLCAGAFYDSFCANYPCDIPPARASEEIFARDAISVLTTFDPPSEEGGLRITGSMVRTLPTTAAAALVQLRRDGNVDVSAMWAGDSRVYLLDSTGLAQLTEDDTSVPDPMDNLYDDGVLRNIFCSDRKVKLHCRTVTVKPPFMVLAATDGCFGYLSTPMEFEGYLLRSLLNSDKVVDWEARLAEMIGKVAGDDHTLCLASFGYRNFGNLQRSLAPRYEHLRETYLNPILELAEDDRPGRQALWERYKSDYMRYLEASSQ